MVYFLLLQMLHQQVKGYLVDSQIGCGSNATVYKSIHLSTGVPVALKVINKSGMSGRDLVCLQHEVEIMRTLDHPYIAKYFESFQDDECYYISMEFIPNGTLLDRINETHGFNEQAARKVFVQMLSALNYLHAYKNVAHRDLKPENVMLDYNFNVKLIDFGLSHIYSNEKPFMSTSCGSPAYVPPELIQKQKYTKSADIWALGILLYAMLTGKLPFFDKNVNAMFNMIITEEQDMTDINDEHQYELVMGLLCKDPLKRISIKEILESEWICCSSEIKLYEIAESQCEEARELNHIPIDDAVLKKMDTLGFATEQVVSEIEENIFSNSNVIYSILKRYNDTYQPARKTSIVSPKMCKIAPCVLPKLTSKRKTFSGVCKQSVYPVTKSRRLSSLKQVDNHTHSLGSY